MLHTLTNLPKTIWIIGLISLLNDSASEMIYPLLPFYIINVLGAGPKLLGLIEGLSEATASLFKLFSGILVDKLRVSKVFIIIGYTIPSIGRPLLSLVNNWQIALIIRFFDRVGKGLRTSPRDAILALSVPENKRGLAFGLHRSLDNAGAFIGPMMATLLLSNGFTIKHIFLFAIIPGLIAVFLTFFVSEPPFPRHQASSTFSWKFNLLPINFKRFIFAYALLTLGNSSDLFILLRAKEIGVPEKYIPILWALLSLTISLISTPLSALSDKLGRKSLLITSWLFFALFNFLLALWQITPYSLMFVLLLFGLYKGLSEGIEKALVADLVPAHSVGTAFGWFNLTGGLLLFPSSFLFGFLYEYYSFSSAFIFSAFCSLLASILVSFILFKESSNK